MKIGLIGNMNNINFSLMRYFRDFGVDARLLLYSNDGTDTLQHFRPECDTWSMQRWSPYVERTNIPNALVAALDSPASWLVSGRSLLRRLLGLQSVWIPPVSRAQIRKAYSGYDRLIAAGISPATLQRINRPLDLFYPYSLKVEYLEESAFAAQLQASRGQANALLRAIRRSQARGIARARLTLVSDDGVTRDALNAVGARSRVCAIPMVYTGDPMPEQPPTEALREIDRQIAGASISILHHARLMWVNHGGFTEAQWRYESKNNHWFFKAFAAVVHARPDLRFRLLIVEYGPDVNEAKRLVKDLGIADVVTWLPMMERRELMWILSRVTIGVGQFYDFPKVLWGGTAWEVLAAGKPLIQGFAFGDGEFERLYGYPPPPMLAVASESDVRAQLERVVADPRQLSDMGRRARGWFDRYNGVGLARQWLDCLALTA